MLAAGAIAGAGSLLGGALGAAGSAVAGKYQLQATRETNKQNYKIWREQIAEQRAQWERENAYNSPLAQRQRLEEAGFNPLSQMDTGNASSMTMPEAPDMQVPSYDSFMQSFQQLGNAIANGSSAAVNAALAAENNARQNAVNIQQVNLLKQAVQEGNYRLPFVPHLLSLEYKNTALGYDVQNLAYRYQQQTYENNIRMNQIQTDMLATEQASKLLSLNTQKIFAQYDDDNALHQMLSTVQTYHNLVSAGAMTEQQMKTEVIKQCGMLLDNEGKTISNRIAYETADGLISAIKMANAYDTAFNKLRLADQNDFNSWFSHQTNPLNNKNLLKSRHRDYMFRFSNLNYSGSYSPYGTYQQDSDYGKGIKMGLFNSTLGTVGSWFKRGN